MASQRKIVLGNVEIGGGAPVVIQSMTISPTYDVKKTVSEIRGLEEVGCEVVRVSVPDKRSLEAIPAILKQISVPLIADIHFDHRLALGSVEAGVQGVRINPGNIGSKERVRAVIRAARKRNTVIRIGVNSGSLERDLLKKYGYPSTDALVESAIRHVDFFEKEKYTNFKISLKSSDVRTTIEGYRKLAKAVDYPLHLGVTEAGPAFSGSVKSAIALGALLADGIGDTIRVSLTADSREEIKTAREILKALGLRNFGPQVIACPSCARAEIDVVELANRVERAVSNFKKPLKIAVMGCAVNGPGEARDAHVGIAGGKKEGLLYLDGKTVKKVPEADLFQTLMDKVQEMEKRTP